MRIAKRLLLTAALAAAVFSAAARAQEGRGDVVYVPTPQVAVDEMLKMAKVAANDFVIDLGSGDGRIVITAAKKFGARGLGVDLDTVLLKRARDAAKREGVADRAQFIEQNLFETDLSRATVITTYLLPDMNEKLRPRILALKPGTRLVAHDYDMGEWQPDEEKTLNVPEKTVGDPGKSYVFFWVVPAVIAGLWVSLLYVVGRGVIYEFDFDQSFQRVSGDLRVDGKNARLPIFNVRGDRVSFEIDAPQGTGLVKHRFQGQVKQDTIEGTVTVGTGQKPIKWTARLKKRGELRMSALDAAESASR
ncbi:MAG: class I SAM-dependent methyltransferase [Betaproteobacteria bacterium]|nr:class I SAM-dependent methyltransferase [Betaproteobacteria bacterium]